MKILQQVGVIAVFSVAFVLTLTACHMTQETVSLKEAKKITATSQGRSFTPPPKTIENITAILDKEEVADLAVYYMNRGREAPPSAVPRRYVGPCLN